MRKNIFYVMSICALLFSCTGKETLEPRKTVIAGVVENYSDDANVIIVNYCDQFSSGKRFAQNLAESGGRFQTAHDYLFAQNMTLRFNNKFINLYVNPGDSVFVKIDANAIWSDFEGAVTFSGDNAQLNKELLAWSNYGYAMRHIPEFDYQAPAEEFLAVIQQNFAAARDSIEVYSQRVGMSPFMKEWAYTDYKFIAANYLMDYNNTEADMWAVFTDPVFDVFNEDNFHTMMFPLHLGTCMRALIQSDPEIGRLASEEKYAEAVRLLTTSLREKAPAGVVRDAMLYDILKESVSAYPEVWEVVPEIKTGFSQAVFINMLEAEFDRISELPKARLSELNEAGLDKVIYLAGETTETIPDVELLNWLARKYEGKVLYIDVWATWCGPCIEEFKSAAELHRYFEGKDVVFVNLCLSSDFAAWQPSVLKYNVEGENYFLGNNATQQFMGEYNLNGFPSYIIVGREGEVYNPAPRPSNMEATIRQIESLLNRSR